MKQFILSFPCHGPMAFFLRRPHELDALAICSSRRAERPGLPSGSIGSAVFLLFLVTIFLTGCASHDLDGTWTFDSKTTRKLITRSSSLPPAAIEHLIKAYKPHQFCIAGNRYKMVTPDGISEGSIRIRRLSENAYKVTMTCVKSPPGDTAIVTLENFGLIYTSLTPLFRGERTAYILEKAEQDAVPPF